MKRTADFLHWVLLGALLLLCPSCVPESAEEETIEELLKHTSVTAVVKAGPIINDAILEDAVQVGLPDVCEVIDNGGAFVGSSLDHIPPHFRARMDRADVIVGKGQGNYETIDEYPGDVFLILRAKCEVVARHMGVQLGQVGLISTRARRALKESAP